MQKSSNDEFLREVGLKTLLRRQFHKLTAAEWHYMHRHGVVRVELDLPMPVVPWDNSESTELVHNVITYRAVDRNSVMASCLGVECAV